MVTDTGRFAGSTQEFENDWRKVLANDDQRYYIYPAPDTGRHIDFFEWIKASQIEMLLAEAGINQGKTLEYGCGAAGISLYLAQQGYEAHICDLSPDAIKVARRNRVYHKTTTDFASVAAANAMQMPYATASFDVVMSHGLLEHFQPEALQRLLQEVVRVLKPGGMFIADIVPGPERLNARTLGLVLSAAGSMAYRLITGKWEGIREIPGTYFEPYYESTLDDQEWLRLLRQQQLRDVSVAVCRPFPPLALSGKAEAIYTTIIERSLTFHRRFDNANNWLTRRWGWQYLATGLKCSEVGE